MPQQGQPFSLSYSAINSSSLAPVSGDVAHHTLTLICDGVESTPTNSPADIGNGEYSLLITAAESNCQLLKLKGTSSTGNVVILPVSIEMDDQVPIAGTGSGSLTLPTGLCYFNTTTDADTIAASIPPSLLPAYNALTDPNLKAALLQQASLDIDRAMRYQGRRYDTITQVTEFPRVAYEPSNAILPNTGAAGIPGGSAFGSTIWDVDPTTLNIVVPNNVYEAVIHQTNYLAGGENSQVSDQFFGVTSQGTGSLHKSYGKSLALETGLCRRAYQLIKKYQLKSGRYM